ncbi:microtubule-associated protein 4-like [Mercenaria mercenaria]|uniref:microtubule-associated protein 4-like n=1 Tax=Mercenaria mercenaria TaxID=6596 RepID=UPI00234F4B91|nr:microtubule-associated protein 4-like [Mercenaria mercenaria]
MSEINTSLPQPTVSPISTRGPSPELERSRSKQKDTSQLDSSLDKTQEHERKPLDLNLGRSSETDQIADDEMSTISSPMYSEQWEEYSSPRKTARQSQLTHRSLMTSEMTHRSRESGRLSPAMESANVEVGTQPLTLPRFNEPLKLRKGRHFVDFQAPAPTVVYVPHRSSTHGRWTNVAVERKNGRYVVIEQRPIHTQFTEYSDGVNHKYQKDVFGPETSWTKKKAPWSWSTKGNTIERSVNRKFYEPYLPPMKERYAHVDSRVGSLDNYEHQPGGGTHKVPSFKLKWEAEAKVGSLPNTSRDHASPQNTLKFPNISPRFGASAASGSFTSIHYTPGGNVILRRQKIDAKSQVGSLDNISHSPGGGDVHMPKNRIKWKKESKIGSLDNITHLPKSSNVQVFKEKLNWDTEAKIGSLDNAYHAPKKGRFKVPHFGKDWNKVTHSRVDSLSNVNHYPRGGNVQIIDQKLKWKAKPKIESHWKFNYDYKSLFGDQDDNFEGFSQADSHPFTV